MYSNRSKMIASAIIVAMVIGLIFTITRGDRSRDLVLKIEPIDPTNEITVHVSGAVDSPGLLSLPRGARVSEALDLAGLSSIADTSSLQLAALLEDEQTIIVPEVVEVASSTDASVVADPQSSQASVIDVNSANVDELQSLPGIGPAIAGRIVEHRERLGPFETLDDLREVQGISDRMIDEFRDTAIAGH